MSIETKIINRLNAMDEESKLRVLEYANILLNEKKLNPVKDILEIEDIKKALQRVINKYPVSRVNLFGSYARGEANEESDVDLIIEFTEEIGLFKKLGLKEELAEVLNRDVDLIEIQDLDEDVKINAAKEMVSIYEN
ncbi:nucleotidyltransferase family protein [Desulfitobacterium sp. Sab5]|uniref:type VII toxin-antitoxin system MntA family adenylyltransferase antitoxin n=1 Tax=Desulfitobacterium nosdiversum TaxID=3375356 RepID=UPI003CF36AFD